VTGTTSGISLVGIGGVGAVSLSGTSLTFAARDEGTTSISQTITLTNSGDQPLTLSGVMFSGANAGDFSVQGNTCGTSIAVGVSCTISVSFDPSAPGARSAILQIVSSAASSPDSVQVSGTGN
jgi:trimeric autotransporter adhesin